MSRRMRHGIVVAAVLGTAVIALWVPPVPQPPACHDFADTRSADRTLPRDDDGAPAARRRGAPDGRAAVSTRRVADAGSRRS
jgi:hypothetical protein